jgi:hypothetical protein
MRSPSTTASLRGVAGMPLHFDRHRPGVVMRGALDAAEPAAVPGRSCQVASRITVPSRTFAPRTTSSDAVCSAGL